VVVLDTPAINAGAVGTGAADAVVIVSRGLVDRLDRDETQGVIGHVVASIAQGDLRASLMLLTIPQTLGLVGTLIGAPVGKAARRSLWKLVKLAIGVHRGAEGDAKEVCELLAANADDMADVDESSTGKTRLRDVLRLPFIMGQAAFWMSQKMALWLIVGPMIALLFRARRYLADATAVELTRYPDGLARALVHIAGQDDVIPGAEWSAHFFVVGAGAGKHGGGDGSSEAFGSLVSLDPPIARRLRHLQAAGATVEAPATRKRPEGGALVFLLAIAVPLGLLVGGLMLVVAVALIYVSLAIDMLFLLPPVGLVHLLLRHLSGG
jgi:Zn-dependent protease with chaperone function